MGIAHSSWFGLQLINLSWCYSKDFDINSSEVVDTGVNKDQRMLATGHTQSISAVDYTLGKSSAVVGEFSANAANLLGRSKACRASCLS